MFQSIVGRCSRRLVATLPLVVVAVLLMSLPAAAWSGVTAISYPYFNSLMIDNELAVVDGGYVHYFYSSENGPTYRRGTLAGDTFGIAPYASKYMDALASDLSDAEGITQDGGLVGVVYSDNSGPQSELFAEMGANHGQNWGPPIKLASYNGKFPMGNGSIAMSGQTVLVAWTDGRNGHVNLRRSVDGGVTFGSTVRLATTSAIDIVGLTDGQVHLAMSGARVVATWNAASVGRHPKKLVMRRSTDGGASFKGVKTLDAATQAFDGPSVAVSGSQVLISHGNKAGHVLVMRSANGGTSFTSKDVSGTKLTDDRSDISVDPANPLSVRVVWYSHTHIYLRRSSDGGVTWTPQEDTRARGEDAATISPNVIVSGSRTMVVWDDYVPYNDYDVWQTVGARTDDN